MRKMYLIRGQKVMSGRDLPSLYKTEIKQPKRAERRNMDWVPVDLRFELSKGELSEWRHQMGPSNFGMTGANE